MRTKSAKVRKLNRTGDLERVVRAQWFYGENSVRWSGKGKTKK